MGRGGTEAGLKTVTLIMAVVVRGHLFAGDLEIWFAV